MWWRVYNRTSLLYFLKYLSIINLKWIREISKKLNRIQPFIHLPIPFIKLMLKLIKPIMNLKKKRKFMYEEQTIDKMNES